MSFPILTPHEIISALQGVGYQGDLTPDDIMKPTPAKMCNFYEWLLTLFSDISRDDLREATREPLINVHHPVSLELFFFFLFSLSLFHFKH